VSTGDNSPKYVLNRNFFMSYVSAIVPTGQRQALCSTLVLVAHTRCTYSLWEVKTATAMKSIVMFFKSLISLELNECKSFYWGNRRGLRETETRLPSLRCDRSRTKATASQQREANNINMSLMQLWRCLQGMRRKVSSFI